MLVHLDRLHNKWFVYSLKGGINRSTNINIVNKYDFQLVESTEIRKESQYNKY